MADACKPRWEGSERQLVLRSSDKTRVLLREFDSWRVLAPLGYAETAVVQTDVEGTFITVSCGRINTILQPSNVHAQHAFMFSSKST